MTLPIAAAPIIARPSGKENALEELRGDCDRTFREMIEQVREGHPEYADLGLPELDRIRRETRVVLADPPTETLSPRRASPPRMAASESGGGFTGPLGRQRFQFGEILGGLRRVGNLTGGGGGQTKHDTEYQAGAEPGRLMARTGCFYLGMYIQDNLGDIKFMLEDQEEWPPGSTGHEDLDNTIGDRFTKVLRTIYNNRAACEIPAKIEETVRSAHTSFAKGDNKSAVEALQGLENETGFLT